jgi:Ca-activated chloride channel family protein
MPHLSASPSATPARHLHGRSLSAGVLTITALALLAPPAAAVQMGDGKPLGPELTVITNGEHHGGAMPLKAIGIRAEVVEGLADVSVEHVFQNPYDVPLEVLYTFPLPDQAAVDRMSIVIGDRTIRGVVKTREDARKTYEEAKAQGRTAALLDQERPNVFTQQVAGVLPGEDIIVRVGYRDAIPYEDGHYELVIPTTVGPRFSPAGSQDVAAVTPPTRVGHREGAPPLRLSVKLDTQLPLSDVESPSHPILVDDTSSGGRGATITLDAAEIPNKDFILRYRLGGDAPSASLMTHKTGDDGYFLLQLSPQLQPEAEDIVSRELVFVVDNSGSMGGRPMQAAKSLVRMALDKMRPHDRFQILRFSESASAMSDEALLATEENKKQGRHYIDGMHGMGGTMMIEGIKAALDPKVPDGTLRIVLFLTDGYIGNDTQIIDEVQRRINDDTRLFSLGVGSSPNRFLLDRMAEVGRGAVATVGLSEDPAPIVDRFYTRIDAPVLTHIDVGFGDLKVVDVTPAPIPDLFADQPLVVFGRYTAAGRGKVTVHGRVGKRRVAIPMSVTLPEREEAHGVISAMWARRMIADLEREGRYGLDDDARREVTRLALEHQLMSKYTSFVAVDEEVRYDPVGEKKVVHQPVEMPEGVSLAGIAAVELTRTAIPPGDPVLSINAPNAVSVVAHFPFGMTKALRQDSSGRWFVRFLVPKGFDDATYHVRVVITGDDGEQRMEEIPYRLDGEQPEIEVEVRQAIPGVGARIIVTGNEALSRVTVRSPWGPVELGAVDEDDPTTFEGIVFIPDGASWGEHALFVVALDEAGNTGRAEVTVEVMP